MTRLLASVVVVVSRVCVAACNSPPQAAIAAALAQDTTWSVADCQRGDLNKDGLADFVFTLTSADAQNRKISVVLTNREHTFFRVATTAEWSAISPAMTTAQVEDGTLALSTSGAQSACSFGLRDLKFRLRDGQFVLATERDVHSNYRCPSLHQTNSETGRLIDYVTNTATYWRHQGSRKVRRQLSFRPQLPVPLTDFDIAQYGSDSPTEQSLRGYIDDHFKLRFSE